MSPGEGEGWKGCCGRQGLPPVGPDAGLSDDSSWPFNHHQASDSKERTEAFFLPVFISKSSSNCCQSR